MRSVSSKWDYLLAASLVLAAGSPAAAIGLTSLAAKPDQASSLALHTAVTLTIPTSIELIASDGAANDAFGASVALSGTSGLIGASFKSIGANSYQGAA
jgi:hypothetical protein